MGRKTYSAVLTIRVFVVDEVCDSTEAFVESSRMILDRAVTSVTGGDEVAGEHTHTVVVDAHVTHPLEVELLTRPGEASV